MFGNPTKCIVTMFVACAVIITSATWMPHLHLAHAVPRDATETATGARESLRSVNTKLTALSWQYEQALEDLGRKEEEIVDNGVKLNRAKGELSLLRDTYNKRVDSIYRHGNAEPLKFLLDVTDVNDFLITTKLLLAIGEQDCRLVKRMTRLESEIKRRQARLQVATIQQRKVVDRLETAKERLARALGEQQALLGTLPFSGLFTAPAGMSGLVFPVMPPYSYIDSWGAPRMKGTAYAHPHEGVDIMALAWSKVLAIESGTISKMGTNTLGGISLWLRGDSGTEYYYAHLYGYAKGLRKGDRVVAGQHIGYIGDTGNAKGTPHLHFEMHPGGKEAVNAYQLLMSIDTIQRAVPAH